MQPWVCQLRSVGMIGALRIVLGENFFDMTWDLDLNCCKNIYSHPIVAPDIGMTDTKRVA